MRILVVDDNRDSAEMLRALLVACGNTVHTAYDGGTAIKAAEAVRPDAILLDIGLPGVNGYDVCRSLRQTSWCRDTLIVAQTGWGQDQDLQRSHDAGFDAHFTKPVDDEALLTLLAEWRPGRTRFQRTVIGPGASKNQRRQHLQMSSVCYTPPSHI